MSHRPDKPLLCTICPKAPLPKWGHQSHKRSQGGRAKLAMTKWAGKSSQDAAGSYMERQQLPNGGVGLASWAQGMGRQSGRKEPLQSVTYVMCPSTLEEQPRPGTPADQGEQRRACKEGEAPEAGQSAARAKCQPLQLGQGCFHGREAKEPQANDPPPGKLWNMSNTCWELVSKTQPME